MSSDLELRYHGLSAFTIETDATSILVDPWIEPDWTERTADDFEDVDYIFVTHGAHDHLGATYEIADISGALVVTEPAVGDHLRAQGLPEGQVQSMVWGNRFDIENGTVRALETSHISYFESGDEHVTGTPLGFCFNLDTTTIYYLGDTALFSDLHLFGGRYEPDVALVPVGAAPGALAPLPPDEAATAVDWLGVDVTIPVHYVPGDGTIPEFKSQLDTQEVETELLTMEPDASVTL